MPGVGAPLSPLGATASNVLGLAVGREWVLRRKAEKRGSSPLSVGEQGIHKLMESAGVKRVQILSTLPHSSIAKAASIVGLGRSHVVSVSKTETSGVSTVGIDFERLEAAVRQL